MQSILKKIGNRLYKPYVQWRISKHSTFRYKQIDLIIPNGIFHPKYFNSTLLLAEFLESLQLQGKTFLELGCGSGLLSCIAARASAVVTASDIHPLAIQTLRENAAKNKLEMEIILSDLFDNLNNRQFDLILINPPYYPKNPRSHAERAWYCGEHFEYFEKLFAQLYNFLTAHSTVYMILSDACDKKRIEKIAAKNKAHLQCIQSRKYWSGVEEIFQIMIAEP